ncbi:MAG: glycosyltransferase family 4 protein [Opitutus sp.]|nr:glycosyltransferase family 4 protein [Opitutus sp.]
MRILLSADPILPVPPSGYGGIERIVDALARALRARGHAVGLLAKAGSTCEVDALFSWPGAEVGGRVDTVRNALALRRAAGKFRADLVHSFARLSYLLPLLPDSLPKIMSYQRHLSPGQTRLAQRLARRGTLRFTACSEFIAAQGRRDGGDWTAIPNFVDPSCIPFSPAAPDHAPLLFLSRIESIKGPDIAIAIARRSGRRLLLAGNAPRSGPEAEFFTREIAPLLGKDGIEWVGEVGDEMKFRLLSQAAALLVPIRWDEPFGIVFAEALAAGTPVISCARGAVPEIVRHGKSGWLIPEGDAAAGAAAVARLSELDRAACRRDAVERFGVGPCTDLYLALYHRALHRT